MGVVALEEPELDSDNERVIGMYDGIRKILASQKEASKSSSSERRIQLKRRTSVPSSAKHILPCGRILKVDVEPRLVVITVEKLDGELRELRIEAVVE